MEPIELLFEFHFIVRVVLIVFAFPFLDFLFGVHELFGADRSYKGNDEHSDNVDECTPHESCEEPTQDEFFGFFDSKLGKSVQFSFVKVGICSSEVTQGYVDHDGERPEDKEEDDEDALQMQPSVKEHRLMVVFCQFNLAVHLVEIVCSSVASGGRIGHIVVGLSLLVVLHRLLFLVNLRIFLVGIVEEIHLRLEEAAEPPGHWEGQEPENEGDDVFALIAHVLS